MAEMTIYINGVAYRVSRATGTAYNNAIRAQQTAQETQRTAQQARQQAQRQESSSRGAQTTAANRARAIEERVTNRQPRQRRRRNS